MFDTTLQQWTCLPPSLPNDSDDDDDDGKRGLLAELQAKRAKSNRDTAVARALAKADALDAQLLAFVAVRDTKEKWLECARKYIDVLLNAFLVAAADSTAAAVPLERLSDFFGTLLGPRPAVDTEKNSELSFDAAEAMCVDSSPRPATPILVARSKLKAKHRRPQLRVTAAGASGAWQALLLGQHKHDLLKELLRHVRNGGDLPQVLLDLVSECEAYII